MKKHVQCFTWERSSFLKHCEPSQKGQFYCYFLYRMVYLVIVLNFEEKYIGKMTVTLNSHPTLGGTWPN